jgi:hypothetical protein
MGIPVQEYQLDYYGYQKLKACRSIRRVCIPWSLDYNWPLLCAVLSTPNKALCFVVTNNTAENFVTPYDGDVYLEN